MNLFLDLDGTLLDSKLRMYKLFDALVSESKLKYEDYWERKFQGLTHSSILREEFGFSNERLVCFETKWMSVIESEEYLEYDSLINGVVEWLNKMASSYSLYLVTARQSLLGVERQLYKYSILNFFDQILVTEQKKTKVELIQKSQIKLNQTDWFIGDTGYDVLTGKSLGIKSLSVLSGFMTKESLKKYNPDLILNDVTEFQ